MKNKTGFSKKEELSPPQYQDNINYLDKLPLLNFYLKLYFPPLKMKFPITLNYLDKLFR